MRIVWTTNEPSNTQVEYGLTTGYGSSSPLEASPVTSHAAVLSGLRPGTTYQYRVRSADAAGNLTTSGNAAFTTLVDTMPPAISSVAPPSVTPSSARITWTTDEASTSQVEYGLTGSYGSASPLDPQRVTAHSVLLGGLSSSTSYHYRVKSTDAAGNTGMGGDLVFTTAPSGTKASQQWNADCSVQPDDGCNATAFSACAPDDDYRGEHVNDVVVNTTTPRLGDELQVSCHMGDFGDTDRDVWELWYNDGNGWRQVAKLVDPDGCGAGVQNCIWVNKVTITGRAGMQALRCINHYYDSPTSNGCRSDSAFDVDEIRISANP